MKINAIDIKPGNVLEHQNKLWLVLKRELVQPGKGGAFAQVEMRDLRGGSSSTTGFAPRKRSSGFASTRRKCNSSHGGRQATFMDNDTYEQVSMPREMIGDPRRFPADGMVCPVILHEGTPLSVECRQASR